MGNIDLKDPTIQALVIAISGFSGVIIGAIISLAGSFINERLTRERKEIEDRRAFVERQLLEFYGPTIALCRELTAISDLWRNTRKEKSSLSLSKSDPSNTKGLEGSMISKLHQICDMFTKHSGLTAHVNADDLQTLIYSTLKLENEFQSSPNLSEVYEDFYSIPDSINFIYKNLLETEANLKIELADRRLAKINQ
jgi:hypothetical protein